MKKILGIVFSAATLFCFSATLYPNNVSTTEKPMMKLNTSNQGKYEEYKRLFSAHGYGLEATDVDLREIDADPVTVVVHKASQMPEGVIVEDTSLDVEGAAVGINVRWLLDHLPEFAGKKAVWTVLLAYQKEGNILVYRGVIDGVIVQPQGSGGFGFDPVFLPVGARETLAQSKPDEVNARAAAVKALISNDVFAERTPILNWDGPWQTE